VDELHPLSTIGPENVDVPAKLFGPVLVRPPVIVVPPVKVELL
jgi:hypothetical protein